MSRTPNPQRALLAALTKWLGPLGKVRASTTPWSSATFDGARHQLSFVVPDTAALAGIGEADLPLFGHFVAEIIVTKVDGNQISVEALTIKDI